MTTATPKQKQHVDFYRKIALRKRLLVGAPAGPVYVPFIGDGDIAQALYTGRQVYGADLDPARVSTASTSLPGSLIRVFNCDQWPFPDVSAKFAVADFDAYSHPYASFTSFWQHAGKARQMVLFFTDGHRQGIMRSGSWIKPDGTHEKVPEVNRRRQLFNFYYQKYIKPWFVSFVDGYKVVRDAFYLRGMMLYWGAIVERS